MSKIRKYNFKDGTCSNLTTDLEWYNKYNELYYINKFNYIHYLSLKLKYIPVFITLTLPSSYHQFKTTKNQKKLKRNKRYKGYTIEDGYKKLQEIFRDLYNNFSVKRSGKAVKIKKHFIRVIEPHKDYTPHLHAVLYIPSSYLGAFERRFKLIVDKYHLEQVDYQVLDKEQYAINYLLKYVSKSLDGSRADIKGWALIHKIKMVTTSNSPYGRRHYDIFLRLGLGQGEIQKGGIFVVMEERLEVRTYILNITKDVFNSYRDKGKILDDYYEKFRARVLGRGNRYCMTEYILNIVDDKSIPIIFEDEVDLLICNELIYDDMFVGVENGVPIPIYSYSFDACIYHQFLSEFGDDETIETFLFDKKTYTQKVLYCSVVDSVEHTELYNSSWYSFFIK
jgi:hypothetical protein